MSMTQRERVAEAAGDVWFEGFRSRLSVDSLLCHPKEAIQLCDAVRVKLGQKELQDAEILRTLLASRKLGKLPTRTGTRNRKAASRSPRTRKGQK